MLSEQDRQKLRDAGYDDSKINAYEAVKSKGVTAPEKKDLLQKTGDVVNAVFPGKQVGQAIGTLGGLAYTKAKDIATGRASQAANYDISAPSPLQTAGDVAQSALSIAGPKVGLGSKAIGRVAANAALGAGIGGTGAIAKGQSPGSALKEAATGAAVGGGLSVASEGVRSVTQNIPRWLTKFALPKLEGKNVDYAIDNMKIGSLKSLHKNSGQAMMTYEGEIQKELNAPRLKGIAVDNVPIFSQSLSEFPNASYQAQDLLDNAKSIAPKVSKLIDKFAKGEADIQEINTIRKELDSATKTVYTSLNRPPETKLLGASLANAMRTYVKKLAPATDPIFQDYAKEISLNKALQFAVKKSEQKVTLRDLIAAGAGFTQGGLEGALKAIIVQRVALNPAVGLGTAKAVSQATNVLTPTATALVQGAKSPLIKQVTD